MELNSSVCSGIGKAPVQKAAGLILYQRVWEKKREENNETTVFLPLAPVESDAPQTLLSL